MILTGDEIKAQLGKNIIIDPFDAAMLNPNSYNLRLHDELLVYEEIVLDVRRPNRYRRHVIPPEGFVLQPGQLYLVPMLEGRSSIGRLGLFVHVTAGFGDIGFCGFWTLELYAIHPIRIYPGLPICQIIYHTIVGEISEYRRGKYQDNQDIQPSLLFKELQAPAKDPQMRLAFGPEMSE